MPPRPRAQLQAVASLQAAKSATEVPRQAAKSAEVQAAKSAEVQAAKSGEVQPRRSPQTSTAAKSPGQSPGRTTKNSNKPTSVGSTAEEGGSTAEEGGSTLQGSPEKASKKRKKEIIVPRITLVQVRLRRVE